MRVTTTSGIRCLAIALLLTCGSSVQGQQPTYLAPIELRGQTFQGAAISRHDEDGSIAIAAKGTAAGIEVVTVVPGGPAAIAGVLPGDIIVSIDGVAVKGLQTSEGLELIAKKKDGEAIDFVINRNGRAESTRVTAGLRGRLYASDPVWKEQRALPPSVSEPIFGGHAKLTVGMFQDGRLSHHALIFVNVYNWDGNPFVADDTKFFVLDGTNQQLEHVSLDEIKYSIQLSVARNWRGESQPVLPIPARHEYKISGTESGSYAITATGGGAIVTGSSASKYTVTEKPDYLQLGFALLSAVQQYADAKANQKAIDEANTSITSWERTYFKPHSPIVPGENRGGDVMYWTASDRKPEPPYRVIVCLRNPDTQKDEYFTFAFGPGAEKIKQDLAKQARTQPVLSNDDVVRMVKAGLSSEIIIAEIKAAHCAFETTPQALIELKNAAVSDGVILAMLQAPKR